MVEPAPTASGPLSRVALQCIATAYFSALVRSATSLLAHARCSHAAWLVQSTMRLVAAAAAVMLFVAACTTPLPQPLPTGAGVTVGDIHGSWRGTWGGAPAALLITDQQLHAGYSGLYIGNYQLLGNEQPGVSGILTSQIDKEQTSVRAYGWFGGVGGQLTLRILADSPSGQQRLTLRPDGPDRLVGVGESSFRWGPSGPIELTRVHQGPPAQGGYWYYCPSVQAYYPDTATCDQPWVKVPSRRE
jgi:hypothetical protein